MNIDKRRLQSSDSVIARVAHLKSILASPENHINDESVYNALTSQGALSSYQNHDLGIIACSLNTLKRAADSSLSGGFLTLDILRNQAKNILDRTKTKLEQPNPRNKAGLQSSLTECEEEISLLKEDLASLTWAFHKLLKQSRNYADASNSASIKSLCKKEQAELLTMISSRQRLNLNTTVR